MISYKKTILPSGITVVSEYIPTALSTVIGFYVNIGSRDEHKNQEGLCHFIEHSVFKGTKNRNEREISTAIESRGGTMNASTSREWTSFYAHVLPEELSLAVDVLSDLIRNPLYCDEAIEMERLVILEEIKSFYDSPESLLFYHAMGSTFGKEHPLSSPILGTPESVCGITPGDILNFWKDNYTTDRMFVSAVGKVKHEELCDQVNEKLGDRKGMGYERKLVPESRTQVNIISKPELNHEYVTLSSKCFPYNNNERFPFLVGLSILGMGMSSRLFQKIRQEMGLVYYVSAFPEFFSDTGIFYIYLSTDKNKLSKTLDCIVNLLNSLEFSPEEVEVAKERIKGNIVITMEDNASRMGRNVKEEMYLEERVSIPELLKRIENVKFKEVNDLRKRFFNPKGFNLTLLGGSKDVTW